MKPLEDVRVVDLSLLTSGPLGTMLMADQGADVIVVEGTAPAAYRNHVFRRGGLTPLIVNHTRGKRSIAVDLASDAGREVVLDLIDGADVVVQNFRPGVVDRLGIGADEVRERNPRVIYASISGYGPTGPRSSHATVDPVIQAVAGIIHRQQSEAIPIPDLVRNIMVDKATALTMAQAVTAALFHRERTGEGAHLEIPMLDAAMYFFWPDAMTDHTFVGDGVGPGWRIVDRYRLIQCADAAIIVFPASEAQAFRMWELIGHAEWTTDPRFCTAEGRMDPENSELLARQVDDAFGAMKATEIVPVLQDAGIPAARVQTDEEAIVDPQVLHNGTLVEWEHPQAGTVRQPRHPVRFSTAETPVPESAPLLGEHTDEILGEIGRTPDQVASLRSAGVVA